MTKYGGENNETIDRQARRMDEVLQLYQDVGKTREEIKNVVCVGLTSHDAVLGAQKFGDLADFDGSVNVLHNII